jgi:hypothetical protein
MNVELAANPIRWRTVMQKIEAPTYVLDYRKTLSCATLSTLIRAKSGNEQTMEVHVRPEHDTTSKPILAKATSNPASKTLRVVVTTENGEPPFYADFGAVLQEMSKAHPNRSW